MRSMRRFIPEAVSIVGVQQARTTHRPLLRVILRSVCGSGPISSSVLFVAWLCFFSPGQASAHSCSDCGGDGQPACCVLDGCGGACDSGNTEVLGCSGGDCGCSISRCYKNRSCNDCGGEGQPACCLAECGDLPLGGCRGGRTEYTLGGCTGDECRCNASPISSIGRCYAKQECGKENERTCCLGEGTACASGLAQFTPCGGITNCLCSEIALSAGICKPTNCGGEGERGCCAFGPDRAAEGLLPDKPCHDGLVELSGCQDQLGDAACQCSGVGITTYSSGRCFDPHCGGEGERACCLLERSSVLDPGCGDGLIEAKGCAGDCSCTLGGGNSTGTCVRPAPCGGEGERACCTLAFEFASGTASACAAGLTKVPGCSGNCFCGKSLTNVVDNDVLSLSDSSCVRFADIAEPSTGFTAPTRICPRGTCESGGDVTACTAGTICGGFQFCSPRTCNSNADCVVHGNSGTVNLGSCNGPCEVTGYTDLHVHLFADIGHGGGVLAGAPCPRGNDTFCSEAFPPATPTAHPPTPSPTPGPQFFKGGCSSSYCDSTMSLDVNDALKQCYGTDHNLVATNGDTLDAPVCPAYLSGCGARQFHTEHSLLSAVLDPHKGGDAIGGGTKDSSGSNLGAPAFNGWPQATSTTHQQTYYKWLERAWRGGLRLIVQMAVTNTALCKSNRHIPGFNCDDSMAFIDQQLQAAYDLENYIDKVVGNGVDNDEGWFRIVFTPDQAREAIANGKLAVVLGIEVDHLFNCRFPKDHCQYTFSDSVDSCDLSDSDTDTSSCRDPNDPTKSSETWVREQVAHYYNDWGVRHMFPIHNFDNAYGGAATWQNAIEVGNRAVEGQWYKTRDCYSEGYRFKLDPVIETALLQLGFGITGTPPLRVESASCNYFGLFPLGKVLIDEMMNKGMIIDIDHMSSKAIDDTLTIAEAHSYPLIATHALFRDLHNEEIRHERMRTQTQLKRLNKLNSMLAVMLKDDVLDTDFRGYRKTKNYDGSGISDDCRHSTKTFAQAYKFAVDKMGGRVGMGSDFNGVAGHFGPRFGNLACGGPELLNLTFDSAITAENNGMDDERSAQLRENQKLVYPFSLPGFGFLYKQVSGEKTFDFNVDGLAHIGLLPDFVKDMSVIGLSDTDLDPLMRSAEEYIRLWERALGQTPRSGCDYTPSVAPTPTPYDASRDLTDLRLVTPTAGATLSPAFDPSVQNYEAKFDSSATTTTLTLEKHDASATVTVQWLGGVVAGPPYTLGLGSVPSRAPSFLMIQVSKDGQNKIYTVEIWKLDSDADLGVLALNGIALSPAFDAATTTYNMTVSKSRASTTVFAFPDYPKATVVSGTGDWPLALGANVRKVMVKAEDPAVPLKIYTVNVFRNGNADLAALKVLRGGVEVGLIQDTAGTPGCTGSPGFLPACTSYETERLTSDVTSVQIDAVTEDPAAVIESGTGTQNLISDATGVLVKVKDDPTEKTYSVLIRRRNGDANLSALSLSSSDIPLSPSFSSGVTEYSMTVASGVSSTTVGATASNNTGGITTNPATVSGTGAWSLGVGKNVRDVVVTADDPLVAKVYALEVYREAPPTPTPTSTPTQTPTQTPTSTPTVTPTRTPIDIDSDGVANTLEEGAPNGGDGNGDGSPDDTQPNVASLPNGADGSYLTIVTDPSCPLAAVRAMPLALADYTLPFGALSFELPNCPSSKVTIYYHNSDGLSAPPYYYVKQGPYPPGAANNIAYRLSPDAPHYVTFGSAALSFDPAVGMVMFTLTESVAGDDTAGDHRIVDQGGPALRGPSPVPVLRGFGAVALLALLLAAARRGLRR
ncbi:MAG: cadherin-like beta sandwich domain-containing protein [Deltaproteobacteria bacterium]|nr:cadherin-like beta sandwich domain-containing protein [Deltaproteobacteria bacterium]